MPALFRELSRALSYRQRCTLALVRTFSGSLSLFCSSIVIYKIYLRYKEHRASHGSLRSGHRQGSSNTYYRLLFGVSVLDVMYSFWAALSVIPVPQETGGVFAFGTVATCSAQGFFVNAGGGILIYMAMLNTYFMLKIRYNIPDAVMAKRYELWFHAFPLFVWLTSGIIGLSLKAFGPIILPELGCWIGTYPAGCWETNTCTRGFRVYENNDLYAWSFMFIWLFLCVIVVTINSTLIYLAIRKQERRNEKYLAKLHKKGPASSSTSTKRLLLLRNSSQSSSGASQLSLPDFDFVDLQSANARDEVPLEDAPVFLGEEVLSTDRRYMQQQQPEHTASPTTHHEDPTDIVQQQNIDETTLQAMMVDSFTIVEEEHPLEEVSAENYPALAAETPAGEPSEPISSAAAAAASPSPTTAHVNQRRLKQSRMVAMQSSCYIFSALFLAVWTFIPWVGHKLQVDASVRFFFAFMTCAVSPAQGLLNLLIFIRVQYVHLRETKKDEWSRFRCFRHCLFSSA